MYLGLDQSPRRIGFAIGSPDMRAPINGVFFMPKAGDRFALTLATARDWLTATIKLHRVTHLCFEAPVFAGMTNALHLRSMLALAGAVELVAWDLGVECREVHAQTWRVRFIGRARAPKAVQPASRRKAWIKDQCIRSCLARGWEVKGLGDGDDAEACGILDYFLACDFPEYAARKPAFPLEPAA